MRCAPNEMGTVKTLSVNELRRITGISQKQYKQVAWHTTAVVIRQMLSVSEYLTAVQNILNSCKSPEGEIAIELLDFAIRVGIVSAYAFVELPEDVNELYYLMYASDLYDLICSVANKSQIESIKKTINTMTS